MRASNVFDDLSKGPALDDKSPIWDLRPFKNLEGVARLRCYQYILSMQECSTFGQCLAALPEDESSDDWGENLGKLEKTYSKPGGRGEDGGSATIVFSLGSYVFLRFWFSS